MEAMIVGSIVILYVNTCENNNDSNANNSDKSFSYINTTSLFTHNT